MGFFRNTFTFLLLVTSTWALHESDVGVIDWHKHLIGVPLSGSASTAPVFHLIGTKSVILTATGNNVLAALHPENGSVAWRHVYEREDQIAGFFKHENVVASLSGPGGSTLRTFEALTGHVILEKRLHTPENGHLSELRDVGVVAITFGSGSPEILNVFVLSNGHTISYLDGYTGDVQWSWSSPDHTSQVIYSKLVATPEAIYAVGVSKSFASYTLHITSLSPITGEVLASKNIPSTISEALTELLTLSHTNQPTNAASPRVVWLEQGSIKSVGLTPMLQEKSITIKGSEYARILDVGLCEHGELVSVKADGSSRVLKLQADGSGVKSVWEFAESASSKGSPETIFAGGLDKLGKPYITRVYWSYQKKQAGVDLFSGYSAEGQGLMTSFFVPFDTSTHGLIDHAAMDVFHQTESTISTRLVITSSTGAVQLWQRGDIHWTREESLAALLVAEFVELPERIMTSSRVGDGEETFFVRLLRQISDGQGFPHYIFNFIKRFATGSYESATSSAAISAESGPISRDVFGFRQVIVTATAFGKVFGIDSSNGKILWSRVLGLGWAAEVGGRVQAVKLFVTRTVSDGESPQVVLVTQRRAENDLIDTVIFHFDALTGKDATNPSDKVDAVLEGKDIISGPLVEAYLLDHGAKIILLLDEFLQVYLYPDTEENKQIMKHVASSLHFPLRTSPSDGQRLMGHQILMDPTLSDKFIAYPTWTLSLPARESIQSMIPAARGPVASIGKVLANRTTLYKYLNSRLFTVLTASHAMSPSICGIYLVDGSKGSIVYRAAVPSVAGNCNVQASLVENWLVYHYFDESSIGAGQAKGCRLVTVELYEGQGIDEKTRSSDMSSSSHASLNVTTLEQTYVFPHMITAMAMTSTKFGISSKDLIVASGNHQIQSFHRRLLNPLRPNRKVTSEEQEEFLVPYDPILPYEPRRVLSHKYEIANIQRIIASPALLESTSLIFAYGLDMFLTRVAPSNTFDVLNENFNKVQLVLTVSGLALAIMITKPMVRRKRLREKWYQ